MDSTKILESMGPNPAESWQLKTFRRTLKKQQKLKAISSLLGDEAGERCLLVTCGDNNGALNWHFKRLGGTWMWADCELEGIEQIEELLGDPVEVFNKTDGRLGFADDAFDTVVAIDVHEHLRNPAQFNRELARVTRPAGRVVLSTPNGEEQKIVVRIKHWLGMTPQVYGHHVVGYNVAALSAQLEAVGVKPYASASYSRFFTEMLELVINFAYVKLLRKPGPSGTADGKIAPQTLAQLKSVEKTYRLYAAIYPLFWAVSQMDALLPFDQGYAVAVAGRREG